LRVMARGRVRACGALSGAGRAGRAGLGKMRYRPSDWAYVTWGGAPPAAGGTSRWVLRVDNLNGPLLVGLVQGRPKAPAPPAPFCKAPRR